MDYSSVITQCANYIQDHPADEITAEKLAEYSGYSLYHLSSVFRACMGCSVGRYILEEKLRLAERKVREGEKITDIALEGGFDTNAGFTKAFRKQYGSSPRKYQKKIVTSPIQPEYVRRSSLRVYGYVVNVEDDHEEAGKGAFWSNINFREYPSYPHDAADYAEVGAWINPDARTGKLEYFFGYVTSDPRPTKGFHEFLIPEGNYALFRLPYPADSQESTSSMESLPSRIRELWSYIFSDWFALEKDSDFDDGRLCFEKYGRDCVELYVPLR